jgi:hypothetical protein
VDEKNDEGEGLKLYPKKFVGFGPILDSAERLKLDQIKISVESLPLGLKEARDSIQEPEKTISSAMAGQRCPVWIFGSTGWIAS